MRKKHDFLYFPSYCSVFNCNNGERDAPVMKACDPLDELGYRESQSFEAMRFHL